MFENTENNHCVWTYNKIPMTERKSIDDVFGVTFGTVSRDIKSFSEEIEIAINKIVNKNPNSKICIAYSGGRDSEYIVRKFHKMKLDFEPVFWRMNGGYNDHDYYYAKKCCDELKINLKVVETNTAELFLKDDPVLLDYAIKNKAYGLSLAWYMWNYEYTDYDVLILADGILTLTSGITFKDEIKCLYPVWNQDNWFYRQKERLWLLRAFAKKINRNVITDFYRYTPEIMMSQIESTEFKECYNNNTSIKEGFYNLLHKEFPEMERRPKFHGMENDELQSSMRYYRKIIYKELPIETYCWISLEDVKKKLLDNKDMNLIYKHSTLSCYFDAIGYFNKDSNK